MPRDYDFFEGVLKNYITATEDGEPVISENDLEQALAESEIPKSDADELRNSLDVENGYVSVENYLLAIMEYAESKADERNPGSGPESGSEPGSGLGDSAEEGGFVNDEDENNDESDEYVDDEENNDDEEDDEDYKDPRLEIRDNNTKETIEQVFKLISNSRNQLTVESLKKAFERINFPVDEHDLKSMLEIASTKPQFSKLWDELYN